MKLAQPFCMYTSTLIHTSCGPALRRLIKHAIQHCRRASKNVIYFSQWNTRKACLTDTVCTWMFTWYLSRSVQLPMSIGELNKRKWTVMAVTTPIRRERKPRETGTNYRFACTCQCSKIMPHTSVMARALCSLHDRLHVDCVLTHFLWTCAA